MSSPSNSSRNHHPFFLHVWKHAPYDIVTLGIIRGLRVFPEVYTLTGGGPARSSEVVMTYIHRVSFVDFDLGYAAALSSLLFLLTVALTALVLFLRRERA